MKKILEAISEEMKKAFAGAGYEEELGKVTLSNRPDLCEYQCNGAMAGAKKYHKAPIMIANEVAEQLKESKVFFPGGSGGSRIPEPEAVGRFPVRISEGNGSR